MEVKIGVTQSARELVIDAPLETDAIEELVRTAISDGSVLALTDAKGRRIVVAAEKIAYVEIATSTVGQVGFKA
ncbi:MAG TPA: DUF3107 domain-containing protein [Marmoricola sp.]|jgi:hypothetical protein|nr:DUF3107 domain-containing protein [Marmoricola sp.]